MVGRGELTESAWTTIEPLLPRSGARGGQWRDHRTVIKGILWKPRTGAPWRDLPARFGAWQTCADRLYRWRREGAVGLAPHPGADQIGCGGGGGLGGEHRQFDRPRPSARQWGAASAESG
jgi:transposase